MILQSTVQFNSGRETSVHELGSNGADQESSCNDRSDGSGGLAMWPGLLCIIVVAWLLWRLSGSCTPGTAGHRLWPVSDLQGGPGGTWATLRFQKVPNLTL
jgi:hypothetical protein